MLELEDPKPFTDELVDEDRPWIVIVWNDPINLMIYVTYVFQKVFGYSKEKANKLMLDVHHKGRGRSIPSFACDLASGNWIRALRGRPEPFDLRLCQRREPACVLRSSVLFWPPSARVLSHPYSSVEKLVVGTGVDPVTYRFSGGRSPN